jgi:hypothetical protein
MPGPDSDGFILVMNRLEEGAAGIRPGESDPVTVLAGNPAGRASLKACWAPATQLTLQ